MPGLTPSSFAIAATRLDHRGRLAPDVHERKGRLRGLRRLFTSRQQGGDAAAIVVLVLLGIFSEG